MKLTSIEIHPENAAAAVVLSFRDPRGNNPYNIRAVSGLDAEEILPQYYGDYGSSKLYNLMEGPRTIVFQIGLNPDFTAGQSYSDLRDAIYKIIASARTGKVEIQFKNDINIIAEVYGYISKFESPHFDQNQTIQLTVKCDEPFFKSPVPISVNVAGLNPFVTTITDNLSTAPHGFTFDVNISGAFPELYLTDFNTWDFTIDPAGGFLNGDQLYFSSEFNNKYLYLIRGGNIIYLSDVIVPGSIWPSMFPGANLLSFNNPGFIHYNNISYYATYWGV